MFKVNYKGYKDIWKKVIIINWIKVLIWDLIFLIVYRFEGFNISLLY